MSRLIVIISVLLLLAGAQYAHAQTPVVRSTEIVSVDGKKFYLHRVKKGETLFGISKAYNVIQKDIALENPDVFDGLKIGQELRIPVIKGRNSTPEEMDGAGKYLYHKVEKGQTVYSIAKSYKTTVDLVYENNPEAQKGIKPGQLLRIPQVADSNKEKETDVADNTTTDTLSKGNEENTVSRVQNNETEGDDDKEYKMHKVKKKETLYSLSKKYNLTIQDIINDNPSLKETGLVAGEKIKIRIVSEKEIEAVSYEPDSLIAESEILDTAKLDEMVDTLAVPCDEFDYKEYNKPFNIALLLPFNLDEMDVANEEEIAQGKHYFPKAKPFLEFYEGLLIAVDSMRNKGLIINLFVYDTKKDSATTAQIIAKPEFLRNNLIIGPAFSKNLALVSEFSKEHKINLVSPFYSKKNITASNPYLLQVNPSMSTQLDEITNFLSNFRDKKLIVVHQEEKKELEFIKVYQEKFSTAFNRKYPDDSLQITILDYNKCKIDGLTKAINDTAENLLIIPSADQAFVSDIITKLNSIAEDKKIILFGLPAWQKFDNIELEYLHNLYMNTFLPYYIDYDSPEVINFVVHYRDKFKAEPLEYGTCNYSMCGYDIARYFMEMFMLYGENYRHCLEDRIMLQSRFSFRKISSTGGYENTGIYVIRYDNEYKLVKIEPENFSPKDFIIDYKIEKK